MSTSVRCVRRLIAERRIAFVKLGRHVRIAESDITAFIESGRVAPLDGFASPAELASRAARRHPPTPHVRTAAQTVTTCGSGPSPRPPVPTRIFTRRDHPSGCDR
jgi:excisionase family DNA binding protein